MQDASPSRCGERMTGSFPYMTASPEKWSISPMISSRSASVANSPAERRRDDMLVSVPLRLDLKQAIPAR